MTREEAITNLNMISVAFVEPVTKEQRKLIDDTFEMAIQALSQEPTDAVSRILNRMWNCRGKHTTSIDKVAMEQIIRDELPSVTPKPIECDDAISRDAVCEIISDIRDCISVEGYWAILERLKKLPPVSTTKNIVNHGTMNITL